jgi:hypothetical protein
MHAVVLDRCHGQYWVVPTWTQQQWQQSVFFFEEEGSGTCGVNHHGDFIALGPNTLYIMAKYSPTRQGLQSPKLDTSRLTSYYVTHLEAQTHDLNEWYMIFALINLTLNNCHWVQVDQQEQHLGQPLQTPSRARTQGLCFGQMEDDKPDDDDDSLQDEQ